MKITEVKKDLFSMDDSYTLVHCISEDCAMGAGIAVEFNKRFNDTKNDLLVTLKDNDLKYPLSILFISKNQNQKVINMITKEKYWHKPTYGNFWHALEDVVLICQKYEITKLAMPKIGSGLDKLEWSKVKEMIEESFEDLDIEIVVCYI